MRIYVMNIEWVFMMEENSDEINHVFYLDIYPYISCICLSKTTWLDYSS